MESESNINDTDTVRSIAELIKPEDEIDHMAIGVDVDVEQELHRRGFNQLTRLDSQAPESIVAKHEKTRPRIVWTRKAKCEVSALVILACCIIAGTVVIHHFYKEEALKVKVGRRIYFNEDTRLIEVNNVHKDTVLFGHLGLDIPEYHLPYDCSDEERRGTELCLRWKGEASLNITYIQEGNKNCYDIEWESLSRNILPHDCYKLSGGNWFGGGLRQNQKWPIEKMSFKKTVFLPGNLHNANSFGPVVERYWLSSLGVALYVEADAPLHVSINKTASDDQICFIADYADTIYVNKESSFAKLNYTICVAENVKEIHKYVVNKIGKPSVKYPDEKYFRNPVWSIGTQYGKQYTQKNVEDYAVQIVNSTDEGARGTYVLDQGWDEKAGDLEFDPQRFPNAEQMMITLKNHGFDVCLAVHPFISTESTVFQKAVTEDRLLHDGSASATGLSKWWSGPKNYTWYQGQAASIDIYQTQWWKTRLDALISKYGPLKLRMNHGDIEYLPYRVRFHDNYVNPGEYSSKLATFVASFGTGGQVQSVYHAQDQPVIVRLGEFNSTWESLQAVIPSVLHAGIIGYPYIMPDVIGGNQLFAGSTLPDKELYIRWLQLSTFLPIMQFSVHPAKYDAETQAIAKAMISLRTSVVVDRVLALARSSSQTMDPIIRPMWWKDPSDDVTYSLDDQFLVGDDLLVAPMVTASTSRDVYFPSGVWRDENTQNLYTGPAWQRNQQVPLDKVLYYVLR